MNNLIKTLSLQANEDQSFIDAVLKRGDVWTASGGNDYARNPPPVVILQDNSFDSTASITVCAWRPSMVLRLPGDEPLLFGLVETTWRNALLLPTNVGQAGCLSLIIR